MIFVVRNIVRKPSPIDEMLAKGLAVEVEGAEAERDCSLRPE